MKTFLYIIFLLIYMSFIFPLTAGWFGTAWAVSLLFFFIFILPPITGVATLPMANKKSDGSDKSNNNFQHTSDGDLYAPYEGDKSMVGGVVGGSATPPVGGRAGQ